MNQENSEIFTHREQAGQLGLVVGVAAGGGLARGGAIGSDPSGPVGLQLR